MDNNFIKTVDMAGNIIFINLKTLNAKKDLIQPTAHKTKPHLINDAAYLRENITELKFTFSEYPEELRKNDLFITEYFSKVQTNKKEYKYIPAHLLKNNFFVSACLEKNPDIYLLADSHCHSDFSLITLKVHHPSSFAKYADESLLNDKSFCLEAIKNVNALNYIHFPEHLRLDKEICKETVFRIHGEGFKDFIKHLPEPLLNNFDFIKELTRENIELFPYLPAKYRDDRNFCYEIVIKNTKFFEHVSDNIKNDKSFFNELEKHHEQVKKYLLNSSRNFSVIDILKHLPTTFFDKEFSEKYKEALKDKFSDLSKIHRGNINIIRAVYSQNQKSPDNLFLMSYTNRFTNKEFREAFQDFAKQHNKMGYRALQENTLSFIDAFVLQEELKQNLKNDKQNKAPKLKI